MKLLSNSLIVTVAAIALLGTELPRHPSGHGVPATKCDSSGYCLSETNAGSGGAIAASNNSTSSAAIDATNYDSTAIYARSANGVAIFGFVSSNPETTGVDAQSNGSDTYALESLAESSGTDLLFADTIVNDEYCVIDAYATLSCTEGIEQVHTMGTNAPVATYASESATPTIEDYGTAQISGGVADVQIDPALAAVMEHQWYDVFVTPLGDTRGLYVSIETPTAFEVRENERGRDNLYFNYRIVARPTDRSNERLPLAPALPRGAQLNPRR
jgi:hypothetical protein